MIYHLGKDSLIEMGGGGLVKKLNFRIEAYGGGG